MKSVIIVIAVLIGLGGAFAQNLEFVNSSLWSGIYRDIKITGNYAYCAYYNGLVILNVENPADPIPTGRLYMPDNGQHVDVSSNYAFLIDPDSGMTVINISNPTNPTYAADYRAMLSASDIFINGDYAFIPCAQYGLLILDISNPIQPTFVSQYTTSNSYSVFVANNYAYVADLATGLKIINIADPAHPMLTGAYNTHGCVMGVCAAGNYVYIADRDSGFYVINIADPYNPTLAAHPNSIKIRNIKISANYVYATGLAGRLGIYDISDPGNPQTLGYIFGASFSLGDIAIHGNYAYMASGYDGMLVVDVTDPANPSLAGICQHYENVNSVSISGNCAYATSGGRGLQILNVSDPSNPTQISVWAGSGSASEITVSGNHAFVKQSFGGIPPIPDPVLSVIDISDPRYPGQIGTLDFNYGDYSVSANYFYLAGSADSAAALLQIKDITDPANPILVGSFDSTGSPIVICVEGDYAYILMNIDYMQDHLWIIDVSNPATPHLVGTYDGLAGTNCLFVYGNYAYTVGTEGMYRSLAMIDISDPTQPTRAGGFSVIGSYIQDLFVNGNYAYMLSDSNRITIENLSDSVYNPSYYYTQGKANDIFVSGDYIYVTDGTQLLILRQTAAGIEEIDDTPHKLSLAQNYPNPFNSQTMLSFSLEKPSQVSLDIFDILGRHIERLVDDFLPAGDHQVAWNAEQLSSGIYFYRIDTGDKIETNRVVLIK